MGCLIYSLDASKGCSPLNESLLLEGKKKKSIMWLPNQEAKLCTKLRSLEGAEQGWAMRQGPRRAACRERPAEQSAKQPPSEGLGRA